MEKFKNLNCSIGFIKSDNLLIFKFRKLKFDLKDNFVNNYKKRECLQIALKWYKARRLKNHLGGKFWSETCCPKMEITLLVRNRKFWSKNIVLELFKIPEKIEIPTLKTRQKFTNLLKITENSKITNDPYKLCEHSIYQYFFRFMQKNWVFANL